MALCVFLLAFTSCEGQKSPDKFGGVALYTLREEMQKNPERTLQQVAQLGYAYIEAAGYKNGKFYGMTPIEFKSLLATLKLQPMSSHHSGVTLQNADDMIADVKAAGFTYFVVPIPPMGMFTYDNETGKMGMKGTLEDLAKILNELGQKCHQAGLKLLYHNHDFEFMPNANNIVPIDYLLANVNPKFVDFQMDLYWVTKAGVDPVVYFKKYPGRFKSWHIKDMDTQGRFAPVGMGTINFGKILAQKDLAGMQCYYVEQDKTFDGNTPLNAIATSREGLKKFGFN